MSVYFMFASGVEKDMTVPKGTKAEILAQVARVEEALGLETEQFRDNPKRWRRTKFEGIGDEALCAAAEEHNAFVRQLWRDLEMWAERPAEGGETLTAADCAEFWHGLELIAVPPWRWTGDYYTARMRAAYETLRGRPAEGLEIDGRPLSPKQANEVLWLFSRWLDGEDVRLEVPKGEDYVASGYYGEYVWCDRCGAVTQEHAEACRRRKCSARAEMEDD